MRHDVDVYVGQWNEGSARAAGHAGGKAGHGSGLRGAGALIAGGGHCLSAAEPGAGC